MTTTNPYTDWEKEFDARFNEHFITRDESYDQGIRFQDIKTFIESLLSRKEEEVRSAENAAWVARQRCGECGGEKDGNELSDMCAKCFEEA